MSHRRPHAAGAAPDPRKQTHHVRFQEAYNRLNLGMPHEWQREALLDNIEENSAVPPREKQAGRVLRAISIAVICGQHLLLNIGAGDNMDDDSGGATSKQRHDRHGPSHGATTARSASGGGTGATGGNSSFNKNEGDLVAAVVANHANVSNGIQVLRFTPDTTCEELLSHARLAQIFIVEDVHLARPRVVRALAEIMALRATPPEGAAIGDGAGFPRPRATATDAILLRYTVIAVCAEACPLPYDFRSLFMVSASIDDRAVLRQCHPQHSNGGGGVRRRGSRGMDVLIHELERLSRKVHVSDHMKLYVDNVCMAEEAHPLVRRGPSCRRLSISSMQRGDAFANRSAINGYLEGLRIMAVICGKEYLLPRHVAAVLPDLISHRIEIHSGAGGEGSAVLARQAVLEVLQTLPPVVGEYR